MSVVSGVEITATMPVSAWRLCTRPRTDVTIPGIATGKQKTKVTSRRGPPAGDAVERVDIGHAVSKNAAPSESHSHYKKKDDKPNFVILKVNSKRERSLRALVDCGASNNFVRLQSLARLDFEEVELPRSLRLATGLVVRTEKRVVRARPSCEEKKVVDELIVIVHRACNCLLDKAAALAFDTVLFERAPHTEQLPRHSTTMNRVLVQEPALHLAVILGDRVARQMLPSCSCVERQVHTKIVHQSHHARTGRVGDDQSLDVIHSCALGKEEALEHLYGRRARAWCWRASSP
ncbi:unnamed protein product [Phytophthora fragariaefolia]|uniref:Unnamed protein product n=1 Tax=Phytophthora fragariaefolia TaxID=1490495 RepID=A0A9W6TUY9_9STRA|nr:unnamed protein product [Phytophthora fragariaefolia]